MHEKECVKCEIIKEHSALMEVLHEMLVSELKDDLISIRIRSDDEEHKSDEKACEAIENSRKIMQERHNIEKMKSGYVGGHVKGKDIAETMKEKLKRKEEEVKNIKR